MIGNHRLARLVAATAVGTGLLLTAAGCGDGGDGTPAPPDPTPTGAAAATCRALLAALPGQVDGQRRATADERTRYTEEWGDPAIRLRCGVPRPDVLTPGSEHYNPTADAVEVNGVSWLLEERADGYRFTTTDREVYVEVTVPSAYHPEVNALTDLAAPVRREVPVRKL
mgnify:CR=1 FL=1